MNDALRVILGAIITLLLAWVIISLIIQWWRPPIYTDTGAVNWWTTFWLILVTFIILWIVLFILFFLTKGDACCDTVSYDQQGYDKPSLGFF